MTTFFQNPRTPLPSPIVHAPTIIPPDPESPRLLHVPFPRVTPVRTPRVRFSPIIEVIPPLRFDLPPHAQHINHVSSPRVPNAPTPVSPPRTFATYTPQPQANQKTPFRRLQLQSLVANEIFHHNMHHIYNADGKKESIDSLLNGKNKHIWERSLSNEFGRLLKGNKYGVKFTDTMEFIHKNLVPLGKKVTYASFVFDFRPLKSEPYRCRLVVGGDKLPYPNDASSPAASLLETKILLNSTISDAKNGARFMAADLKDFFLASPMDSPEFMKIPLKHIPEDIITTYNLRNLVTSDGYVYVKIKKGMYGLKQAAILAYNNLVNNLQEDGYFPIPHTVGLWKHATRKTIFCLCVDDFGIKYFNKDDANHLLTSLQKHYTISTDWQGTNYCGLTIKWNYPAQYVDISMPGYIEKLLARLKYKLPPHPTTTPFKIPRPTYGKQTQMAKPPDTSTKLSPKDTTRVQAIVGSILYYARAIEHPALPALNELGHEQNKPTITTNEKLHHLLHYVASFPDATLRIFASDMVLHVDSDAAYLVLPGAKIRIAGYYHLSNKCPPSPAIPNVPMNAPILIICKTIKRVVASAAEAETGGLFMNGQEIIPLRYILHQIGHPQPGPTPLKTDNSTSLGFVHKNIKQKRSKSWDMSFYWLREKEAQKHLRIFWDRGRNNNADYYTKHHAAAYHRLMRPYSFSTRTNFQDNVLLARVC